MDLMSALGYLMSHTAAIMHRQSDQVLQERLGIGMSQYKLLLMLQQSPNVQQRDLADSLGQTEASISRQIKLLCDRNMLSIEINPKNRRQHLTVLTAKGVKVAQAATDVLAEYQQPIFDQCNEKQQQQLLEMLKAMHAVTCQKGKPHACDHSLEI